MFGLFKKKSRREKLQKQYENLMEESFKLSKINRKAADTKYAEADVVLRELNDLNFD
jgi:hypothetical protein